MKKLSIILSCCLLSLLCAIGCKGHHKPGHPHKEVSSKKQVQSARINITTEPSTLDPRKARSLNDLNVIKMLMEGLIHPNYTGHLVPGLAESFTVSEDQKTYTFILKKSKWSNGEPVTAYDFLYAWKKTLSPQFPSDTAASLYVIKNAQGIKEGKLPVTMLGVQAPNEFTLIVQLEMPTPYFLDLLASPPFYPVHAETDKVNPQWAEQAETYVSCGPFKLASWKHHDMIEVVKHDKYWDTGAVRLKKIELVMVPPQTGLSMYQNQELDWEGSPLSTIPLDSLEALKKDGLLNTQDFLITAFIRTNIQKTPLSSLNIRKALALAINRKELIDHVLGGGSTYASGLVPLALGLRHQEYFQDSDALQAKALIEQALKNGELTQNDLSQITLSFLGTEKNSRICQALQAQWKQALNIDVRLEALEGKIYFSKVSNRDFQLALGSWTADFRDPINFLEVFRTKEIGTNNTNWENDAYLQKLELSYKVIDKEERSSLLQDCEKILIEEMPIIPLWHGNMSYVKNGKLKNVIVSDMGSIDFKWAFLDKN